MAVLLVERRLGADHDAHVGERGGLGVGASRITGEFGRVAGSAGLRRRGAAERAAILGGEGEGG